MKSTAFKMVLAISIVGLAALFTVWWVNGRDDTWLYVTSAVIVLTSFLYVSPRKKDGEQ